MPEAEWFQRVDHDDIQIAMDAAMLEGVVQQDGLAIELVDCHPRGGHAIRILHMWHVGQALFEFEGFVVPRAGFRAVTAANQRHAHPASP